MLTLLITFRNTFFVYFLAGRDCIVTKIALELIFCK